MSNTATTTTPASSGNRAITAGVILCLLGAAIVLSMGLSSTREASDKRLTVEATYIEANGCVIAQMDGRHVAKYRCEKPEARYLTAAELSREATASVAKN